MPVLANQRHELFCQGLAKGLTVDEAYAAAGFKPNRGNASRLKANEGIEARLREILAEGAGRAAVDAGRTMQEIARVALSDIRQAFTESGSLNSPADWPEDFARAVAAVEVVTRNVALPGQPAELEYTHKIKLWDKNSGLEKLAKIFGMLVDKKEIEFPKGPPVIQMLRRSDRREAK